MLSLVVAALIALTSMSSDAISQIGGRSDDENYRIVARLILDKENDRVHNAMVSGVNPNGRFFALTLLYWAADASNIEAADMLLNAGAHIDDTSGPANRTALHQAVRKGDLDMVKLLVKRGANVGARTTDGRTSLDYATNPPPPLSVPPNAAAIADALRSR